MKNETIEETARAFLINAELSDWHIRRLSDLGYFSAPASMRHHLNRPGGLAEHSVNVTRRMLALSAFSEKKSCYRVGMLHDLVKCVCYRGREKDGKMTYSFVQSPWPGHGVASALIADNLDIFLMPEERAAIVWHMGAFGLDEDGLKEYHAACRAFSRAVILTHAADHLASVFEDFEKKGAENGEDDQ